MFDDIYLAGSVTKLVEFVAGEGGTTARAPVDHNPTWSYQSETSRSDEGPPRPVFLANVFATVPRATEALLTRGSASQGKYQTMIGPRSTMTDRAREAHGRRRRHGGNLSDGDRDSSHAV